MKNSNVMYRNFVWGFPMKKYFIMMCVFIFALTSTKVFAFDGQRKGFIVGGGLGGGFLSNKFSLGPSSNTASQGVILTEFKIGYAPSNTLEIYYINKGSWWRETFFEGSFFEDGGTALLALSAVGVTKYLGTSGTGLFVTGGLGPAIFDSPSKLDVHPSIGFGLFGGVGYEFSKHWSVQADVLYLNISEADISDPDSDLDSFGFRVSLNFLAF